MLIVSLKNLALTSLIPALAVAQVPTATGGTGVDLDGDGMSDLWEAYYSGRALLPGADDDGDGKTNLFESQTGTDPRDALSFFNLPRPTIDRIRSELGFNLNTTSGKSYQFEGSTDLNTWSAIGSALAGNGSSISNALTFDSTLPERYFVRLDVDDQDADFDGLTAYEESLIGYSDTGWNSHGSQGGNDYARVVELLSNGQSFTLNARTVPGQLPSLEESARFLIQAGMGADYELIQQVSQIGFSAWIESEFSRPPNYHFPRTQSLTRNFIEPENGESVSETSYLWAWWDINMRGQDMLRQRVAYALSQILVVSQVGSDVLEDSTWGLADYYDILVRHAFGNYRDILYDVTYHPVMGLYLSHAKNRRADPTTNRFPDENYAREIMQLFSIGLYELNQDGTRKKDANGNDIPTYTNADIREFARIFTGLTYDATHVAGIPGGLDPGDSGIVLNETEFLQAIPFMNNVMQAYEPLHDPGAKQLLQYTTVNGTLVNGLVPAGQTTDQDIRAAIDNIFNHPNVGPFIAHLLIQRLVKSNPSPSYIQRVAVAFNNNGQGVRGDMRAVIRAILLDPEARNRGYLNDPTNGRLREPYLRYLHLCRAFNFSTSTGFYRNFGFDATSSFQQRPLGAPSVFNFYLPNHSPLGPLNDAGLVGPEFEITTASTSVATINFWQQAAFYLEPMELDEGLVEVETAFDLETEYTLMESDPVALVNRLDLILTYGSMRQASKTSILTSLNQALASGVFDTDDAVHLALYLFVNSPEFAVLR